ncbi:MAG: N-formylglutamate deformylase [Xanthomonadales bacterium]|nr:N-formylglutamate deformylase [Xanthomonadales bacterium]
MPAEPPVFRLHEGSLPLLVSMPHDGTAIPADLREDFRDCARKVPDTDWHISTLYDFAAALGASLLVPGYSRYVVDLNRPADGSALYPGLVETGLCPIFSFAGEPLYRAGREPDAQAVAARRERYWQPYHVALRDELARLQALHGQVLLWEAHSIRSEVPMLFAGRLPDLNLGTADGASCGAPLRQALVDCLRTQSEFSWVIDARFKGGYITRHYGQPAQGIHAVQLELAQLTYMDEQTARYDALRAGRLRVTLERLLAVALATISYKD